MPAFLRIVLALALLALAGCAGRSETPPEDPAETAGIAADNDPLEPFNRHVFAANLAVDTFVLRPAAVGYRELVPDPLKRAIRNVLNNLREPFTLVNALAQGDFDRAQATYGRFLMNSLYGLGGIFDVADGYGLPYHQEDFGQTLAVWGMEEGPYLVLPGLGPSNVRDAIGRGVQWAADPTGLVIDEIGADAVSYGRIGLEAVDTRWRTLGSLDVQRRESLDFYAAVRSLYRQRRAAQIENTGGQIP